MHSDLRKAYSKIKEFQTLHKEALTKVLADDQPDKIKVSILRGRIEGYSSSMQVILELSKETSVNLPKMVLVDVSNDKPKCDGDAA